MIVFQNIASKCFSSTKTSRITLVDLAGLERTTLDDAGKQCIKEGKYVKKSISQLGYDTLILQIHIPYFPIVVFQMKTSNIYSVTLRQLLCFF